MTAGIHFGVPGAHRLSCAGKVLASGCALPIACRTVQKQLQKLPLYLSLLIAAVFRQPE